MEKEDAREGAPTEWGPTERIRSHTFSCGSADILHSTIRSINDYIYFYI